MSNHRWSGVGRAVDEHIKERDGVDAGVKALSSLPRGYGALPVSAMHWVAFSRSYGNFSLADGANATGKEDTSIPLNDSLNMQRALTIGQAEQRLLTDGVTHYVSDEMIDLVSQAADVSDPEPLFDTDLPCPHGLVILENPLLIHDLHPTDGNVDERIVMPIRGFGWTFQDTIMSIDGDSGPGIALVIYTDLAAYRDLYLPSIQALGFDDVNADDLGVLGTGLRMVDYNPWRFGMAWGNGGDDAWTANHLHERKMISTVAYNRRWLLALLRLMWQEIIVAEPGHLDRPSTRRAERSKFDQAKNGGIKVLRLRRVYERSGDEHVGQWTMSHRTIVRGHWRRQYYPSLGPVGEPQSYRRIYIDPHVRGPEDAPLVIKHSVTAVVR